jgi:hypothetical protein
MMTDLRELFRTLDRLDAPDLWPEAERRRPGTVRVHRRPSRFIAAAVAFALAIPATVLLVRAFGGSTAGRSPSPRSSVARCIQAKATGDFDGDGTVDTAGFVEVVPAGVACEQEGGVVAHLMSQEIVIRFGSGPTLVQPFSDCEGGACASVFTATDLDGDGRDELAIDVGPGAAVAFVEFYRVDREEIRPLVITAPADPPYVKPGPAILGGGFDSGLQSPVVCKVHADGSREIVSVHAENTSDRVTGRWRVHTTNMLLTGDQLRVRSVGDAERTFPVPPEAFRPDCA